LNVKLFDGLKKLPSSSFSKRRGMLRESPQQGWGNRSFERVATPFTNVNGQQEAFVYP
jgi:hypothetical protein